MHVAIKVSWHSSHLTAMASSGHAHAICTRNLPGTNNSLPAWTLHAASYRTLKSMHETSCSAAAMQDTHPTTIRNQIRHTIRNNSAQRLVCKQIPQYAQGELPRPSSARPPTPCAPRSNPVGSSRLLAGTVAPSHRASAPIKINPHAAHARTQPLAHRSISCRATPPHRSLGRRLQERRRSCTDMALTAAGGPAPVELRLADQAAPAASPYSPALRTCPSNSMYATSMTVSFGSLAADPWPWAVVLAMSICEALALVSV